MALNVNEIFYSIQGESSYSGWPCVFVRLAGCNLRCTYCDTRYAYYEGREMATADILEQVRRYRCQLVEVTGGEPLVQEKTPALIAQLLEAGFMVLLETNGSLDIGRVDPRCVRIVDIKCPSSGEIYRTDWDNMGRLTAADELKFIIGHRDDYEYAKQVLNSTNARLVKTRQVHFSPIFGQLPASVLAGWILEDRLAVRLNLQLHKIIWHPEQRGV